MYHIKWPCGIAAGRIDGKCPQMILPGSRVTSYKSTKRKLALNYNTDDETEEDADDNNGSDRKQQGW